MKKAKMQKEDKATAKKSNRLQGEYAKSELMAERNGDAFAYAVQKIWHEAKTMKGSQEGFLGVEKETLDPKEHAHSLVKKEQ